MATNDRKFDSLLYNISMHRWSDEAMKRVRISNLVWIHPFLLERFYLHLAISVVIHFLSSPHHRPVNRILHILHLVSCYQLPSTTTTIGCCCFFFVLALILLHTIRSEGKEKEKKLQKNVVRIKWCWWWCWWWWYWIHINQLKLMFRIKLITDKLLLVEFFWTLFWYQLILILDALCILNVYVRMCQVLTNSSFSIFISIYIHFCTTYNFEMNIFFASHFIVACITITTSSTYSPVRRTEANIIFFPFCCSLLLVLVWIS